MIIQRTELQTHLFAPNNKNLPVFIQRFFITAFGKYKQQNPICPHCQAQDTSDNGYYRCESNILKKLGIEIRNGHYLCKECKKTFSTAYPGTKKFLDNLKTFLKETCFKLFTEGLSFGSVSRYITEQYELPLDEETARQYYLELAKEYKDKKVLTASGYYHIDCQFLNINGKRGYRLSVIDAISHQCLIDTHIEVETVEEIIDRLRFYLLPYQKKGFIIDGKIGLEDQLKKEFGVPVQRCITHFQALIVKDFNDTSGRNLSLLQIRNMYLELTILINHDAEVQFLNRKINELDKFKQSMICINDKLRNLSLESYEKSLLHQFFEFRKNLKKYRRKNKPYLLYRTEEEIKQKLQMAQLFLTEKHEIKRMENLEKNLESLTHFLRIKEMPATNNGVEHYFSKTLTKTKKKRFRSITTTNLKIGSYRAIRNGWVKVTMTFTDILKQFAQLYYLFAKPA